MMKLVRRFARRLLSSPAEQAVEQAPLYPDQRSCALSVLSTDAVDSLYKTLGTDPEIIKTRLSTLPDQDGDLNAAEVLRAGSLWHQHMASLTTPIPLELGLLIGLLVRGTREVKEALTPLSGMPGDIPFLVAHKKPEAELRALWPTPIEQTGHALLLNDHFSPMEAVVQALEESFRLNRELAIKKMLEVHTSGLSVLEVDLGSNVSDTCSRLNSEWRSIGLPLYCVPQRLS